MSEPTCRSCGESLYDDEGPYCEECMRLVWAFCPQPNYVLEHPDPVERARVEEWFYVCGEPNLERSIGEHVTGGQCDNCGGTGWVVARNDRNRIVVRCSTGEGYESDWKGCGTEFMPALLPTRVVVF